MNEQMLMKNKKRFRPPFKVSGIAGVNPYAGTGVLVITVA